MSEDDDRLRLPDDSRDTEPETKKKKHSTIPIHFRSIHQHHHHRHRRHLQHRKPPIPDHHHHCQQRSCRSLSKQREAGRRVSRKYRQVYIRSLQQQEYDKLLNIVPALASSRHKQRIPKVTVIEETIRYIDQLHEALVERVDAETGGRLKISSTAVTDAAKGLFIDDAAAAAAGAAAGASAGGTTTMEPVGSRCSVCEGSRTPRTPEVKDGD